MLWCTRLLPTPIIPLSAEQRRDKDMKHIFTFLLLTCLLFGLTGCRISYLEPEEMQEFLNRVVEDVGCSQITDDKDLIGTRYLQNTEDSYAGKYSADCSHVTGRDVIFGGASINSRELFLSGYIHPISGKATVRIRLNNEVTELEADSDGAFETTLKLSSGGNYIMVVYEDFTGIIEMNCEYIPPR